MPRIYNKTLDASFNAGVLLTNDNVLEFNKLYHKTSTLKVLEEVIATIPIVVYFRKKSFLVEVFNRELGKLKSAGLIEHWTDKFMESQYSKIKDVKLGPKQMTVKTLLGAFQMVSFGLSLSLCTFFIELGFYLIKNRHEVKKT